jgi:hypothetical protein
MHIRAEDYHNDNWRSNGLMSNNIRSAIHEFVHAAGLNHTGVGLMQQGGGGRGITNSQRADIYNKHQRVEINKFPNSQNGNSYPILHYFDEKTGKMQMTTVQQVGFKDKK